MGVPPEGLFPSIASFFAWQLGQRKGPSQGRNFLGSDVPACIEMPSPGFISTWQTAHMNSLNILQIGYLESNLELEFHRIIVRQVFLKGRQLIHHYIQMIN